eukprot:TRINITY_DN11448_c0_g1_i1.p1 TRINITY_DN11448_c0_g1~~TRINITY_DN11448_c0_g1_i1.p1  ORF type:complete len:258 (+),score=77.91 TRINITY_DN11448_c0_g1_i1:92-865(+)
MSAAEALRAARALRRLMLRRWLTFPDGALPHMLLADTLERRGGGAAPPPLRPVVGVCCCPSEKWSPVFCAPHLWLQGEDGAVTDVAAGPWDLIFQLGALTWNDPQSTEALFTQLSPDIVDRHRRVRQLQAEGFPFKVGLAGGEALIPDVYGPVLARWYYATGEEAEALLRQRADAEAEGALAVQQRLLRRLRYFAESPQRLLSRLSSEDEASWNALRAALEEQLSGKTPPDEQRAALAAARILADEQARGGRAAEQP